MQERSQQTVRRIIDAALTLLARDGVEGLTTNHVADEAGLSVAALYRFFPNKQAVIYAAYVEWIEELTEQIARTVADWKPQLAERPDRWPEAAAAVADVLGESRRGARAEYELLRAMFSHRELTARDDEHSRELGATVAELLQLAGAQQPLGELAVLASFANEQFSLAAELSGHLAEEQRKAVLRLARYAFIALWRAAIEGE